MPDIHSSDLKEKIRFKAHELGFELFGVTDTRSPGSFKHYESWINGGKQASMEYMAKNMEVRKSPQQILPEAKSIISLGAFYNPPDPKFKVISSYALGRDYHKVLKKKLKALEKYCQSELQISHTRSCVDTAPILERDIAERAGLGWIGKNTLLINRFKGSYFFISELFLSVELESDFPAKNHCGTCTACIDACPTAALKPYELDSNRCISYWTIEHRGDYPAISEFGDHLFGCDICQTACPWNKKAENSKITEFQPQEKLLKLPNSLKDGVSDRGLENLLQGSALKRAGLKGIRRNFKNQSLKEKIGIAALVKAKNGSPKNHPGSQ